MGIDEISIPGGEIPNYGNMDFFGSLLGCDDSGGVLGFESATSLAVQAVQAVQAVLTG